MKSARDDSNSFERSAFSSTISAGQSDEGKIEKGEVRSQQGSKKEEDEEEDDDEIDEDDLWVHPDEIQVRYSHLCLF